MSDDALKLTRHQRNKATSPMSTRQQRAKRKRTAQLEPLPLPDSPPRKRRTKISSPVCDPVIASEQAAHRSAQATTVNETENSGSGRETSQSVLRYENIDVKIEHIKEENVDTEEDMNTESEETTLSLDGPSTSTSDARAPNSTNGVHNYDFEVTVTEWLDDVTNASDDGDLNDDSSDDPIVTPTLIPRTVDDQPIDNTGLNVDQLTTIEAHERTDDEYLRKMASEDYLDFDWNGDKKNFTGKREVFTGNPGPTFPVTEDMTVVDVFNRMIDADLIDLMVTETNRYAEQILTKIRTDPKAKQNARALRWKPTDRSEMVAFLCVMILQGLYPKVRESSYFQYDGYGTTPYFRRIMSYNRYSLLKAFHRYVDNELTADRTKLDKIRPIIDYFNNKFAALYKPNREIVIDESFLKRHGRLSFAQKIASTAAGQLKMYELCDSSSGYLWRFRVLGGKEEPDKTGQNKRDGQDRHDNINEDDRLEDRINDNVPGRTMNPISTIVYDLIQPLLHKGHTLIMDNFYNSPLLVRCLKKDKTDVFGTLRLTREFVPESLRRKTKTEMRNGEVAVSYCPDLAVMLFRDSNLVSMISSYHPVQAGISSKPVIVLDYMKFMGGLDRKDQYLASQPLEKPLERNMMWYKKLFRRLFNTAIYNCYVIYTSNARNKISHREFRVRLAEDLLKINRNIDLSQELRLVPSRITTASKALVEKPASTSTRFVQHNHFPIRTGSKWTRCWICRQSKKNSRSAYKCEECQVNLCIDYCFKEYHKIVRL